jgi:hypothetical protein
VTVKINCVMRSDLCLELSNRCFHGDLGDSGLIWDFLVFLWVPVRWIWGRPVTGAVAPPPVSGQYGGCSSESGKRMNIYDDCLNVCDECSKREKSE